jgi:hypothetical protein
MIVSIETDRVVLQSRCGFLGGFDAGKGVRAGDCISVTLGRIDLDPMAAGLVG